VGAGDAGRYALLFFTLRSMSTEPKKPSVALVSIDLLFRCFLLYGLIGLPLFIADWIDWWTPDSLMRTALVVWLFIFGMFLLLIAMVVFVVAIIIPLILIDFWFSLVLGCLGVRSAMAHFRESRTNVGNLIIAAGNALKTWDISFPIYERKREE
jgi:hypothetical protein